MNFKEIMLTVIDFFSELDGNCTTETLRAAASNTSFLKYVRHAYLPECKLQLSAGVPEYEPKRVEHGMQTMSVMWNAANTFATLCNLNYPLRSRDKAFVATLNMVSEQDAIFLLGVKDQTLEYMYPNITLEKILKSGILGTTDEV